LHAGVGVQEAKISNGALYWQPTGSRVYQVPDVTANASARFIVPVNATFTSFLQLDGSYVGNSVSGTAGCQLNTTPGQYFPCPVNGDLGFGEFSLAAVVITGTRAFFFVFWFLV